MNQKIGRIVIAIALPLLLVGGCIGLTRNNTPVSSTSPPPAAIEASAPAPQPVAGGQLNQFFPKSGDGYDVVFVQEKTGFAQANLKQSDDLLAQLSINDAIGDDKVIGKYDGATLKVSGYPAKQLGSTKTSLLINDRFQVSAISKSDAFGTSDRTSWLTKFDLSGLASLN